VQSKNLGYDRQNLIYVPMEGELASKYALFKQGLLQSTGVQAVTRMGQTPTSMSNSTLSVSWPTKDPGIEVDFMQVPVGYDFLKTLNVKLVKGREFSPDFADSSSYLVNERALKIMGIEDNPLGQKVTFLGNTGQIIGVIQDFHLKSLHEQIPPLLVHLDEKNAHWGNVLVRAAPSKTGQVLSSMERLHKQLNPKVPFAYRFSTEAYTRLYKSEQVVSKLSGYLAVFAVFISCLGLLGLITSTSGQRTKEIGIRKVLGASVTSIIFLLSKNLLLLVFIALLMAIPLAWFIMDRWLENFAYHIDIEWWMFVSAGLLVMLIALLTLLYHCVKAALANPVKSLRNE
jgi:ABC-type antimicrobial peptide transport system permease subunit